MDVCGEFSNLFNKSTVEITDILGEYEKILYVLNPNLDERIDLLCNELREVRESGSYVHIIGEGRSGLVGGCLALRMENLGFNTTYIGDVVKKRIKEGDLCFSISGSGGTKSTVTNTQVAKEANAKIKIFTTYIDSPLAELVESENDIFIVPGGLRKGKEVWEYVPAQIGRVSMPESSSDYYERFEEIKETLNKIKSAFYLGGGFETFMFITEEALVTAIGKYFGVTQEDASNRHVRDNILI